MRRHLLVAAASFVIAVVCLWSGAVPGAAAVPAHAATAASGRAPVGVCLGGQTRCAPAVPLGSPSTPPGSVQLAVVLAAGLVAAALSTVALGRRRRGALAPGVRTVLFRPPRLFSVV